MCESHLQTTQQEHEEHSNLLGQVHLELPNAAHGHGENANVAKEVDNTNSEIKLVNYKYETIGHFIGGAYLGLIDKNDAFGAIPLVPVVREGSCICTSLADANPKYCRKSSAYTRVERCGW